MVVKVVCDTTGEVYSVNKVGDVLSIGRHPKQCQIKLPLDANGVSRIHASLKWPKEDELVLEDASSYGTTVNDVNVLKSSATLRNGEKFEVGTFKFTVEIPQLQVEQARKRIGEDVPTNNPKRSKTTVSTRLGTSQRKVSDFFSSQRPSQILAEETPISQMGMSNQCDIGPSSVVANSQFTEPKTEVEFVEPVVKRKKPMKKTSLFSGLAKSHSMGGTPICRETTPSQLATAGVQFGEEIVESSQEDGLGDAVEAKVKEVDIWKDVNSQMNFEPIAHSTQRVGTLTTPIAPSTSKPKKKKSAFQTDDARSEIKTPSLPLREKSFIISSIRDLDPVLEHSTVSAAPRSTRKRPAFGKNQANNHSVIAEPKKSLSSISEGFENRDQNKSMNFDYSCVSSGKKYEEESQLDDDSTKGKKTIKEADIEKVIKNMSQMIKYVDLTRSWQQNTTTATSDTTLLANTTQKPNFKKFKKASQGRFNTSIPCISSALGGGADLVDFRQIRR